MGKSAKASPVYKKGDLVFVKMKGSPYWPARVEATPKDLVAKHRFNVKFYGTHDTYVPKPDQIVPYNAQTKKLHGEPRNRKFHKEALEEIEKDSSSQKKQKSGGSKSEAAVDEDEEGKEEEEEFIDAKTPSTGKSSANSSQTVNEEDNGTDEAIDDNASTKSSVNSEVSKQKSVSSRRLSVRKSIRNQVKDSQEHLDEPTQKTSNKVSSQEKSKSSAEAKSKKTPIDLKEDSNSSNETSKVPTRRSIRASSSTVSIAKESQSSTTSPSSSSEALNDSEESLKTPRITTEKTNQTRSGARKQLKRKNQECEDEPSQESESMEIDSVEKCDEKCDKNTSEKCDEKDIPSEKCVVKVEESEKFEVKVEKSEKSDEKVDESDEITATNLIEKNSEEQKEEESSVKYGLVSMDYDSQTSTETKSVDTGEDVESEKDLIKSESIINNMPNKENSKTDNADDENPRTDIADEENSKTDIVDEENPKTNIADEQNIKTEIADEDNSKTDIPSKDISDKDIPNENNSHDADKNEDNKKEEDTIKKDSQLSSDPLISSPDCDKTKADSCEIIKVEADTVLSLKNANVSDNNKTDLANVESVENKLKQELSESSVNAQSNENLPIRADGQLKNDLLAEKKSKWLNMTQEERLAEKQKMKAKKTLEKKKAYIKNIQFQNALSSMDSEVKKSLALACFDVDRAYMIMKDLIKIPIEKRHLFISPAIVGTIKKCTKFHKSQIIKDISTKCWNKFRAMIPILPNETFLSTFEKEKEKFLAENAELVKKERRVCAQYDALLKRKAKDSGPDAKRPKLAKSTHNSIKMDTN